MCLEKPFFAIVWQPNLAPCIMSLVRLPLSCAVLQAGKGLPAPPFPTPAECGPAHLSWPCHGCSNPTQEITAPIVRHTSKVYSYQLPGATLLVPDLLTGCEHILGKGHTPHLEGRAHTPHLGGGVHTHHSEGGAHTPYSEGRAQIPHFEALVLASSILLHADTKEQRVRVGMLDEVCHVGWGGVGSCATGACSN